MWYPSSSKWEYKKVGAASLTVIGDHYARALYGAAVVEKDLARVDQDLHRLTHLLRMQGDLLSFLENPLFKNEQPDVLMAIGEELEFSQTFKNFLQIIILEGRAGALLTISRRFQDIMTANSDHMTANVKVADGLSDKEQKDLMVLLSKKFNKNVTLDVTTDPSLLGGMTIFVGSQMIDYSTRSKLEQFRLYMKGQ